MTDPFHEADGIRLFLGDCREVMRSLPAESVSCIMTSPPFWGLRSYSCEPSIWGGDPNCPHCLEAGAVDGESYAGRQRWQHDGVSRQETPTAWVKGPNKTIQPQRDNNPEGNKPGAWFGETRGKEKWRAGTAQEIQMTATCSLCGAWRGQLGLEPTVALYIEHTMEWLREAKRVLRKDGVLWLDIGDSRHGSWGDYVKSGEPKNKRSGKRWTRPGYEKAAFHDKPPTAQRGKLHKSLALIPQRIAIACQDDGWIVRSQIIIPSWMPESAKDRPTDSYRMVLMLVRSPRYWYDAQAVRVVGESANDGRYMTGRHEQQEYGAGWQTDAKFFPQDGLRNLGDIWKIPPAAYPDAHFATFATEEPETCIKASCPAEICVKCGKPRVRMMGSKWESHQGASFAALDVPGSPMYRGGGHHQDGLPYRGQVETIGWTDCGCGCGFESATVLDPFIGTGTTAVAARMLGRRCIGIDLSEDYLKQAVTRLQVGDQGIRKLVEARRHDAEQGILL